MTRLIDSQALGKANQALGLTGGSAGIATELMDDTVEQVLNINEIARRSQTLAGTQGIFRILLRNIHPSAGTLSATVDPYNASGLGVLNTAPYPDPVPAKFDLWILGAAFTRFSGSGIPNAARLQITNMLVGLAVDNNDAAVSSSNVALQLAYWQSIDSTLSPAPGFRGASAQGNIWQPIKIRMPRDGISPGANPSLQFQSNANTLATFDCNILCALFATALGQDAGF